jgi:hypothetical protein
MACYHAILHFVLNCKMHNLHMYKRQVDIYRLLTMDDLADKSCDLLSIYHVSHLSHRLKNMVVDNGDDCA